MSDQPPRPVVEADPIAARLTVLEALVARGLAAPAPMAAPPIVIGPFSSVPAPGSPIRSQWAQEVSQYTWAHGIVATATAESAAHTIAASGAQVALTVPVTAYPSHRTVIIATADVSCASDTGQMNAKIYLVRKVDATSGIQRSLSSTGPAAWVHGTLIWSWAVPAGSDPGFDVMIQPTQVTAGTPYVEVQASYAQWWAA